MTHTGRCLIAAAVAAAMTVTTVDLRPALAASPAPVEKAPVAKSGDADFSARKRKRHRSNRGDAAAAAAVLGVFGTIAGLAAASRHRHYYAPYGYHYGPPPYYGGYYYAPPPGYYHYRW